MGARIEGVIVDFGGVLARPPTEDAVARLGAALGVDLADLDGDWMRHRLRYDLDELGAPEYWRLVGGRSYDDDGLERLLVEDAACWAVQDEAMVAWLQALKQAGLHVALLSNMPREQWSRLTPGLAWLDLCDVVTLSYELRLAKPDPEIYRRCVAAMGLAPHEVVFVDDRAENVDAARELGLEAVLFDGVDALRDELSARFGDELPLPEPTRPE